MKISPFNPSTFGRNRVHERFPGMVYAGNVLVSGERVIVGEGGVVASNRPHQAEIAGVMACGAFGFINRQSEIFAASHIYRPGHLNSADPNINPLLFAEEAACKMVELIHRIGARLADPANSFFLIGGQGSAETMQVVNYVKENIVPNLGVTLNPENTLIGGGIFTRELTFEPQGLQVRQYDFYGKKKEITLTGA